MIMIMTMPDTDNDNDNDNKFFLSLLWKNGKTLFISHNQLKYAQDVAETSDPFIASFCLYMFI